MIRFIYNLLWPLGLLLFLPGYLAKMIRRGGYREKFGQRLGFYDREVQARLERQRSTWLHAVSVGEVAVALKVARQLRTLEPDLSCILTVTTTTGFSVARKNAPSWVEVMYSPLDFWPVIRRAFKIIRPTRIILIEAEVWPNLAAEAKARRIPIALVNARLSPKSEKRFRRFRFFVAPTFRLLDLVCVQEPQDVSRWTAFGVERARVSHVGSIKYDPQVIDVDPTTAAAVIRQEFKIDHNRLIVLGGSTHAGEEEILGKVFCKLYGQFPKLFLIIAPRHAERAREIRGTLEQLGLKVVLRSEMNGGQKVDADCVVLDTTGELRNWYAVATIVFMGKSLAARGGQNPVEPIAAGKPVLFGPYMENFSALARALVEKEGAAQVSDANSLETRMADLLGDEIARARLVENAQRVLAVHSGATARTAQLLAQISSHRDR